VQQARLRGTPVEGICLYPILDRHDWDNEEHWHNSGLWDLSVDSDGGYQRILNRDYMQALRSAGGLVGKSVGEELHMPFPYQDEDLIVTTE
jgi:hypothetical protein